MVTIQRTRGLLSTDAYLITKHFAEQGEISLLSFVGNQQVVDTKYKKKYSCTFSHCVFFFAYVYLHSFHGDWHDLVVTGP